MSSLSALFWKNFFCPLPNEEERIRKHVSMSTPGAFLHPLSNYQVAAIQYEPSLGEKERNVQNLLALVEEAARHEARLIVLPEMATTGSCWLSRAEVAPHTEPIPGPTTLRFAQLAASYGCFILLGLPEVDPETQMYYNSVALVGPGGVVGRYRKLHSNLGDPHWACDGDLGVVVWDTPLGRLSPLIGADAQHFETARIAALRGADLFLLAANWSGEKSPCSCWMARAFENTTYLLAANRYGEERGVHFSGGTCLLNQDGTIQHMLDNGQGIVYGHVELSRSRDKHWRQSTYFAGASLATRRPGEYLPLLSNSYLWEPLRFHSLYGSAELPPGQLSCVGVVQLDLQELQYSTTEEKLRILHSLLSTSMQNNASARPDILVLPELLFPGPPPAQQALSAESLQQHFRSGAIEIPGPQTDALVALASSLQISLVVGVAEKTSTAYYNTILLLDPEGVYGMYRKLHLGPLDSLWATPGDLGLPTFDTPSGRIGLATGYDVLFPETLAVLAGKGTDLVCSPALLDFPAPLGLAHTDVPHSAPVASEEYDPWHFLLWRVRASEQNVYLALANWYGKTDAIAANGSSGIFSPTSSTYPWPEVIADEGESGLMMMTIDTREQRTGRRTSQVLSYTPGDMVGSLTGELAYNALDTIPGNAVRAKPQLRRRLPFWYKDLVRKEL